MIGSFIPSKPRRTKEGKLVDALVGLLGIPLIIVKTIPAILAVLIVIIPLGLQRRH